MLSANATVIHLGRIETVKFGSNPIKRPIRAVEYNENIVEIMTEVKISAACLLTSCKIQDRILNIEKRPIRAVKRRRKS